MPICQLAATGIHVGRTSKFAANLNALEGYSDVRCAMHIVHLSLSSRRNQLLARIIFILRRIVARVPVLGLCVQTATTKGEVDER